MSNATWAVRWSHIDESCTFYFSIIFQSQTGRALCIGKVSQQDLTVSQEMLKSYIYEILKKTTSLAIALLHILEYLTDRVLPCAHNQR